MRICSENYKAELLSEKGRVRGWVYGIAEAARELPQLPLLDRHTGASRYPVEVSSKWVWIPAFAGMTNWGSSGRSGPMTAVEFFS